jgi:hypothetical protein
MTATRRAALLLGPLSMALIALLIQVSHADGRLLASGGSQSDRAPAVADSAATPCAPSEAIARPGDHITSNGLVLSLKADAVRIGADTVEVSATTSDGQPVAGALVYVTIRMPSMDHGVSAYPARDLGDGRYQAHDVSLGMAGEWEVTMHVIRQGRTPADATFRVSVGGQ